MKNAEDVKKTFERLLGHLGRSKTCKLSYTDAEMQEIYKERKRV